jgi:Chs5-Arf1p-binding protein BUD7/BCH1
MRVQVQIPGTVESYCVDERGNKLEATEEHWLETYLCSVLRAFSYADNGSGDTIKRIIGVRRFNPIMSTEQEHRFLEAAEKLFFNGMCDSIVLYQRFANSNQDGNLGRIRKFKYLIWSRTT